MAYEHGNYIAGVWKASSSGRTFQDLNPANRTQSIGTFPRSGVSDIEAAVNATRAHQRASQRTRELQVITLPSLARGDRQRPSTA
jgi:acyl-CoA reductase-like NAD-dependent aldehyde dehydrogenase